jgi:RimJ/RimL family protein N-acetyltransferase
VLPLGDPGDLRAAIAGAERFYAARNAPTVFSIGDGACPGLDDALAARGYDAVDPTVVMTADVPEVPGDVPDELSIDDFPSPDWLALWWSVDGRYREHIAVVRDIVTGVAAAYAHIPGRAVGRGVPQGEWYGIYCMAVAPPVRRRGFGGEVLRALLGHARKQGARRAYLIVLERNAAARALYERAGFRVAGQYHYRVR